MKALARRLAIVSICLLVSYAPAAAQDEDEGISPWWKFEDRSWYDPLIAEPRAAQITVLFPAVSDAFEFSREDGRRLAWDITLGKEIPLAGYETSPSRTVPLAPGRWGIGVWFPISFHMIEDHKDPSAPIINTDYRFSLMAKFRYALAARFQPAEPLAPDAPRSSKRFVGIRFVIWGHESTHLGDEFTLGAQKYFQGFERINVSYEYAEYGISYEDAVWTLRHGGILPFWSLGREGYYSDHTLDLESRRIARSANNYEPSFGLEYRRRHGEAREFAPFVSADIRHKPVYDYHKTADEVREEKHWSINVLGGLRTKPGPGRFAVKEIYVRLYRGVNPAGQLRNQKDYTLFGVGFNFSLF